MLDIIEIILFLSGLWAIFTGKLPPVLFDRGQGIESREVRWLGLLLAAVLPLDVAAAVLIMAIWGPGSPALALYLYPRIIVMVVVALFVGRRVRRRR